MGYKMTQYTFFEQPIKATRVNNDSNGNPRFVVHYLSLGLDDYVSISKFGLDKYRAKWFGGGYVFSYYGDLTNFLNTAINKIKKG